MKIVAPEAWSQCRAAHLQLGSKAFESLDKLGLASIDYTVCLRLIISSLNAASDL